MADEITPGQALLAEYDQLKGEQRARIRFRDSLMYTTLAAMAAVVVAALQARNNLTFLLLPPVTVVLGWKYVSNDDKIAAIGRYIQAQLAPRLTALVQQPVFCWETTHVKGSRRPQARKAMQISVDLLAFCFAPAAALVTVWTTEACPPILLATSILEGVLVLVTSVFVVMHSELPTKPTMLPRSDW
jgi:hypothetical protein